MSDTFSQIWRISDNILVWPHANSSAATDANRNDEVCRIPRNIQNFWLASCPAIPGSLSPPATHLEGDQLGDLRSPMMVINHLQVVGELEEKEAERRPGSFAAVHVLGGAAWTQAPYGHWVSSVGYLGSKDGSAAGFWSRAGFRRMQWGWAQWKCGLSQDRSQKSRETFRRLCLGKSLTKETGNWSIRLIIRFLPWTVFYLYHRICVAFFWHGWVVCDAHETQSFKHPSVSYNHTTILNNMSHPFDIVVAFFNYTCIFILSTLCFPDFNNSFNFVCLHQITF